MGRIVVGVDGSEHSVRALSWARAEGSLRAADVHAVIAWSLPLLTEMAAPPLEGMVEALEGEATSLLESTIEESQVPADRDAVVRCVERGSAAEVLLRAATDADLLVVGSRGRGGFRGLLLGSVSQQCAQHPPCPVVIVP